MKVVEEQTMETRPELSRKLDGQTFRNYYFLKQELVDFCREHHLPVSGGKILKASEKRKATKCVNLITEDTLIEPNIV